jgi:asparagine synthase (glutamine-hydrolysing)
MCGICGLIDWDRDPEPALIDRMTRTLGHRGPDASATVRLGPASLGHTRLSVIDLTNAGAQPMRSSDGRFALVYNGELYNHRELRAELGEESFRSRSDTEVVLRAFVAWGADAFRRFNGMYALAVWDCETRELVLARDPFGMKPLYYACDGTTVAFGSEIKAIAAARRSRGIDPAGLAEYMWYGTALGDRTLHHGIRKLLPGHVAHIRCGEIDVSPFWRIEDLPAHDDDFETARRGVRDRLERAVARHLISDVPVGVFLSGGIDSSAITVLASRAQGAKLRTYAVGFDFTRENELPKAQFVARYADTDHHELYITGANTRHTIEALVQCHDQPFGDVANLPLYLLCQQLGGDPKVILQGDGGDEIFGGYSRYTLLSHGSVISRAARVAQMVVGKRPIGKSSQRLRRLMAAMTPKDRAMRMALLLTDEDSRLPPTRLLHPDLRKHVERWDPFARYRELGRRFDNRDTVQQMLYTDASLLLPDFYLEKVDRATMAHGVEVRLPFLDRELAEYAIGLPSNVKVRYGRTKSLLRESLRGIVPDRILGGAKIGFGVPYRSWLRGPSSDYMKGVLLDARCVPLFDRALLEPVIGEHVSGAFDHGPVLWKALNLSLWFQQALGERAGEPAVSVLGSP